MSVAEVSEVETGGGSGGGGRNSGVGGGAVVSLGGKRLPFVVDVSKEVRLDGRGGGRTNSGVGGGRPVPEVLVVLSTTFPVDADTTAGATTAGGAGTTGEGLRSFSVGIGLYFSIFSTLGDSIFFTFC